MAQKSTTVSSVSSVSSIVAVRVSKNLQLGVVIAAFLAWALTTGSIALSYVVSTRSVAVLETHIWQALISSAVFPLVLFLITYRTSRQYVSVLNRIFIAVLKTSIAATVFTLLHGILMWTSGLAYQPLAPEEQKNIFSSLVGFEYLEQAVVLLGVILVEYRGLRNDQRR